MFLGRLKHRKHNPEKLLHQLWLSFGEPHVEESAQQKLHKLIQASLIFMDCFIKYRKLVLAAEVTGWPEEVKTFYLETGMSGQLQLRLFGKGIDSQSFQKYCDELIKPAIS